MRLNGLKAILNALVGQKVLKDEALSIDSDHAYSSQTADFLKWE